MTFLLPVAFLTPPFQGYPHIAFSAAVTVENDEIYGPEARMPFAGEYEAEFFPDLHPRRGPR